MANLYDAISSLNPEDKIDQRIISRITQQCMPEAEDVHSPEPSNDLTKSAALSAQKVPQDMMVLKLIRETLVSGD